MKDKVVSRRYAEGFLNFCRENIGIKQAFEELDSLKEIVRICPALEDFLADPEIESSEKCAFIERVFKESFCEEARNFLEYLIQKGRVNHLSQIADFAKVIYQRESGIEKAVLRTAQDLDSAAISEVKYKLEERLHKKLEMEIGSSSELIGAIQVAIGNIIIDGSIKRKLSDLKESMLKIKVHPHT